MTMDIGISKKDREKIADGLSHLLADSYTLYLKTHNFHWNVTGPMFNTLHVMFMDQYTELWNALDLIAERIRALGFPAPGTYREFVKLTVIKESEGVPSATEMLKQLLAGQEAVTGRLQQAGGQGVDDAHPAQGGDGSADVAHRHGNAAAAARTKRAPPAGG